MTCWFGLEFAVRRAKRYAMVHWMYHSDYMQMHISRAFDPENKPKALYRAKIREGAYIVGVSLTEIKNTIRVYKTQGEEYFTEAKQ